MMDNLKRCISENFLKNRFDFGTIAIKKIFSSFAESGSQFNLFLEIFVRILGRIKKGQGYRDMNNEDGKCVHLQAGKKKIMIIFYTIQQNKRFLIYDFKIINK